MEVIHEVQKERRGDKNGSERETKEKTRESKWQLMEGKSNIKKNKEEK